MVFGLRISVFGLGLALLAPVWGAEESTPVRDGAFWVQTVRDTEAVAPGGRLTISTRSGIAVHGGSDEQVRFTLTKRVKARTEAEARRRLAQFLVRSQRQGDTTVITVVHAGDGFGGASLDVSAPHGLREVIIETHGGAVEANDLSGALRANTGGGGIRLDRIGGPVVAKTAGGEIVLGTMGSSVRCTSAGGPIRAESIRGEAWLETAGGDIVAREVGGPVHASTAGGGIQILRAGSRVSVNTAGGAIEVGSAKGMVTAESLGGSIEVGAASGVRCESGGGAIRLSNVSGSLRASTAVGNIVAQLLAAGAADSFLATGAGDITVLIPSNLGITIRAQMESAQSTRRIVSEFPGVKVRVEGPLVVAEGAINGGGPMLRLSGAGGTIYIRRQR